LINRLYIEDLLSFKNVDIEFKKGLIVFSGPSGAGKSILMNAILSLFTTNDTKAKIIEATLENLKVINENYDISNDEFVIKQITSTKTRYLLNNQSIPKKDLNSFSQQFFKHLHLKNTSDFDSLNIISFLDFLSIKKNKNYQNILNTYTEAFKELNTLNKALEKLIDDEKNIEDIKELTKIQIQKIEDINPIDQEYEELKDLKDLLSKKDKVDDILNDIKPFIDNSYKISQALDIININSDFFTEAINEVNNSFEQFYDKIESSTDSNIEETLNRIEDLSSLIKKYGSIEEALAFKDEKKAQLDIYENISFEKEILLKNINKLNNEISKNALVLTNYRSQALEVLKKEINNYAKYLYLNDINIDISKKEIDIYGQDQINFTLNNTQLNKISSGEFNRLRLALLTTRSVHEINNNGILFLDEIDANLSGKESQSIAKVLSVLSKTYQIFAISHQPQLSATADQHYLINKTNNISTIKELDNVQRINEIARMISGDNITNEAKEFAKQLIKI
jgi:DNA repair protein RecN (Recombination protein N)